MTRASGMTSAELLFGIALGLVGLTAMTSLLSASLSACERAGTGTEARVATASTIDQFTRDVRLAGYDPRESGITGIVEAGPTSLQMQADLDGNGSIDPNSEERVSYWLASSGASLQRVVGAQAMPILSGLKDGGVRLRYFDAAGDELDPTHPGAADTIREITIDIELERTRTIPAIRMTGGARLLNR